MSEVRNIFCPECDSLLDISKSIPKKVTNDSDTKSEDNQSFDNNTQAYYFCKSCNWSLKIEPETRILNKTSVDNKMTYLNIDKYKNKMHSKILPYTRNYICPNKKCISNTDNEKHEAVMFRINNTMRIIYTCCACNSVF